MSPEQRAKKALEFIGWGCGLDACKEPDCPSCGCKAYLALAFKEAEDAAYERAAAMFEADGELVEAASVRSLKSQEP